jgi:hypothetical protein
MTLMAAALFRSSVRQQKTSVEGYVVRAGTNESVSSEGDNHQDCRRSAAPIQLNTSGTTRLS